MKTKDFFIDHMEDLALKAIKTGCVASRFLTSSEAYKINNYFTNRKDVKFLIDGGYNGAERVRAIFLNSDWGEYDCNNFFVALSITFRPQYTLGHRDILGTLMALGIERDTIGDIIAKSSPSTLICLPEISDYIISNMTKVGGVGITISKSPLHEIVHKEQITRTKTDTVASLRLDSVICVAFGFSRSRAAEIISSKLVSLNHEVCVQSSKEVYEGSIFSVRGFGRAKLISVNGTSKKGRTFIKIGLYE